MEALGEEAKETMMAAIDNKNDDGAEKGAAKKPGDLNTWYIKLNWNWLKN